MNECPIVEDVIQQINDLGIPLESCETYACCKHHHPNCDNYIYNKRWNIINHLFHTNILKKEHLIEWNRKRVFHWSAERDGVFSLPSLKESPPK